MITIFFIIALIFSVIIHEISHGYIALKLGDTTAKDAGRLTLNPLKHIDIFGSIILPLTLALSGAPVFGWAKPVPYDPRFLANPKKASGLIALAGPASNLTLAIVFSIIARFLATLPTTDFLGSLILFIIIVVQVNVSLAVFNLLPIPPLDGSGVLFSFLPRSAMPFQVFLQKFGIYILIFLVFSGLSFLSPIMSFLYGLLLG
jgi:Zn-dependent protease